MGTIKKEKRLPSTKEAGSAMLVVMAVIMMGGTSALLAHLNKSRDPGILRASHTGYSLKDARDALVGFSKANKRLPCPDTGPLVVGVALGDGVEDSPCNSSSVAIGLLPWKTLGLPRPIDGTAAPLWYAVWVPYTVSTTTAFAGGLTINGSAQQEVAVVIAPNDPLNDPVSKFSQLRNLNAPVASVIGQYLEEANALGGTNYIDKEPTATFNDQVISVFHSQTKPTVPDTPTSQPGTLDPTTADVSFKSNMASFHNSERDNSSNYHNSPLLADDQTKQLLNLGDGITSGADCMWYSAPVVQTCQNKNKCTDTQTYYLLQNKTMRAYFQFQVGSDPNEVNGEGFTFGVIPGYASDCNTSTPESFGYAIACSLSGNNGNGRDDDDDDDHWDDFKGWRDSHYWDKNQKWDVTKNWDDLRQWANDHDWGDFRNWSQFDKWASKKHWDDHSEWGDFRGWAKGNGWGNCGNQGNHKVTVCHKDGKSGHYNQLSIDANGVPAHVPGHSGDYLGPCNTGTQNACPSSGNKSFAVEFDLDYTAAMRDPQQFNHIAIVQNGNNQHAATVAAGGTPTSNPSCDPVLSPGCYGQGSDTVAKRTWMEDNAVHGARIEAHTGYTASTCTGTEHKGGSYALIKAWVDCTDCTNFGKLDVDYTARAPDITGCILLDSDLRSDPSTDAGNGVRFGFTSGFSSGTPFKGTISNFGIAFR